MTPAELERHLEALRRLDLKDEMSHEGFITLLGNLGLEVRTAVTAFAGALLDEDAKVRRTAAWALGHLELTAAEALPRLVAIQYDDGVEDDVRESVSRALGRIAWEMMEKTPLLLADLRHHDVQSNQHYHRSFAGMMFGACRPEVVVPQLIKALRDGDAHSRHSAAWGLAAIGPAAEEAGTHLIEALQKDEDAEVRVCAAWALGRIGPAMIEAVPHLIDALQKGEAAEVRRSAANALSEIGPAMAGTVTHLIDALRDDQDDVRSSARNALSFCQMVPAGVSLLIDALRDADVHVRCGGAEILGNRRETEAVPDLIEMLRDEAAEVRGEAAWALTKLGPAAMEAISHLVPLLGDSEVQVRRRAANALSGIGFTTEEYVLASIVKTAVQDEDRRVREHAVGYLKKLPEPSGAVKALRQMATDSGLTAEVRFRALDLLHDLDPAEADAIFASTQPAVATEWESEAHKNIQKFKLFYLVYRVYMEGYGSLRKASDVLDEYHFAELTGDDLPITNVSLTSNIRRLEHFFIRVFKKDSLRLLCQPIKGGPLHFTKDAQKAWGWTDTFLRKQLAPDWFGFQRLTPEP
jgi:HEAT repeat protein